MIKHTFFRKEKKKKCAYVSNQIDWHLEGNGFHNEPIILYLHYNTFISMRSIPILSYMDQSRSYHSDISATTIWIFTQRIQTILIIALPQQQLDSGRCNFPLLFDVKYVTACFSYVCFYKQFAAPRYHKRNICALEYLNYLLKMHFVNCIV